MGYREAYEQWLSDPYFDEATKAELRSIADDEKEIEDRFYMELEFGTAGLRGVIGAGTNRMNIYTVRKATQGLANYIMQVGAQSKGVAIAYDSRHMSPEFAREAALCLAANGIRAYILSPCGRRRSCPTRCGDSDALRESTSQPATILRNTTDTKYTGKTVPRLRRPMIPESWRRCGPSQITAPYGR